GRATTPPPRPSIPYSPSRPPPSSTPFPYTTLFRSAHACGDHDQAAGDQRAGHDAVQPRGGQADEQAPGRADHQLLDDRGCLRSRSEEHTSELQSRENLVCRLLLEKKKLAATALYHV